MLMSGKDFRTGFYWVCVVGLFMIFLPILIPIVIAILTFSAQAIGILLLGAIAVLLIAAIGKGINSLKKSDGGR